MHERIRGLTYNKVSKLWMARKTRDHRTYEVRAKTAASAAAQLNELLTAIGMCSCQHISASREELDALTATRANANG